jgi:hypothetical protein
MPHVRHTEGEGVLLRIEIEPMVEDPRLTERLRTGLAAELRNVDGVGYVESRRTATGPDGAKSGAALLGGLVISGALSTATLTAVTKVTLAWLERVKARKVVLELHDQRLELDAASAGRQRKALDAWIRLVEQAAPDPPSDDH